MKKVLKVLGIGTLLAGVVGGIAFLVKRSQDDVDDMF